MLFNDEKVVKAVGVEEMKKSVSLHKGGLDTQLTSVSTLRFAYVYFFKRK